MTVEQAKTKMCPFVGTFNLTSEMEKALEILKDLFEQSSRKKVIYSKYKHNKEFRQEVDAEIEKYSEAIAELEEAMKPKTCAGCKHKPNDGECYYEPCDACARFFYDHYEPKVTP